jgi:hypothetical protein
MVALPVAVAQLWDVRPLMSARRFKISLSVLVALLFLGGGWVYFSCPVVALTDATPLWESEYDASREGTIFPGPGIPRGTMAAGDRLRVLWTSDGKDYRACFVVAAHWQRGWVLCGQDGVPPL